MGESSLYHDNSQCILIDHLDDSKETRAKPQSLEKTDEKSPIDKIESLDSVKLEQQETLKGSFCFVQDFTR